MWAAHLSTIIVASAYGTKYLLVCARCETKEVSERTIIWTPNISTGMSHALGGKTGCGQWSETQAGKHAC